jgi:hypothetical protein
VGDVLERILDKGNGAYVPLLAVMGEPRTMAYEDRAAMQHVLGSFSSHPDYPEFPKRLRDRSYALFALGYDPIDDYQTSWGVHFVSNHRAEMLKWRAGGIIMRPNLPTLAQDLSQDRLNHITSVITDMGYLPWQLPTEEKVAELRSLIDHPEPLTWKCFCKELIGLRYYVSATSQALRFLDSLSLYQRGYVRRLVFHEDRKSVALPECHIEGMMPYTQSLSSLSIERRDELWTAVYVNVYASSLR